MAFHIILLFLSSALSLQLFKNQQTKKVVKDQFGVIETLDKFESGNIKNLKIPFQLFETFRQAQGERLGIFLYLQSFLKISIF